MIFKNPSLSIDFSVSEKTDNVYCTKCEFDWDDLVIGTVL